MKKLNTLIILAGCLVISSACVTAETKAEKSNLTDYPTWVVPSEKTGFRGVWVKQKDDHIRVSGNLRLKNAGALGVPKHIEVSAVNADGEVLETTKVRYVPGSFRHLKRHSEVRFTARLQTKMQDGYTVRVRNVD